jgi:hypothetical protein
MIDYDAVNDDAITRILNTLPMTPKLQDVCEKAFIEELQLWETADGRWPKNPYEVRRSGELVDRFQFERDAEAAYLRLSNRAASAAFLEVYTAIIRNSAV